MARLPAVAGSIPEFFRHPAEIVRMRGTRETSMHTDGRSPGPLIGASCTTAPQRVLLESRGASARNWSGGMKSIRNGQVLTFRTSPQLKLPTIDRLLAPRVMRHLRATVLSFSI